MTVASIAYPVPWPSFAEAFRQAQTRGRAGANGNPAKAQRRRQPRIPRRGRSPQSLPPDACLL